MSSSSLVLHPDHTMLLRRADPDRDNAALCALARRCPQGRRLSFYHERTDYRERCRLHADAEVFVVERQGIVAAAAAVARKQIWLGGTWRPVAYFFDGMVDPAYRGQQLGCRLLQALRQASPQAQLFYGYILEDNLASRRLCEREGLIAHPRRLLQYVVLPRLAQREPPPGFHWQEPVDEATARRLDAALQDRYDFLDTTAGQEGVFCLDWRGTRAWAVLRRHGPKVFVNMPWYGRVLGRCLPWLPRRGRPTLAWSLHHIGAEGPDPQAALDRLIASIAWVAARQPIHALLLPLFEDDPRVAQLRRWTLTRWGLAPVATRLYIGGNLSSKVLATVRPLLMSGRDG